MTLVVTLHLEKRHTKDARFYWPVMLVTLVTLYSLDSVGTGTVASLDMGTGTGTGATALPGSDRYGVTALRRYGIGEKSQTYLLNVEQGACVTGVSE